MKSQHERCNIHVTCLTRKLAVGLAFQAMALPAAMSYISGSVLGGRAALAANSIARVGATIAVSIAAMFVRGSRQNIYNILWAVVFGFATLNILSLAARRIEPGRRGLTFAELLAVMVVLLSIFLLGLEMANLFHIFPIRLQR